MQKNTSERRRFKRVIFTVQDGIIGVFSDPVSPKKELHANVLDLSEGGIKISLQGVIANKIKEGDRLVLTQLRGKNSVQLIVNVDTEVKWISNDQISNFLGVGGEFHNLLKEERNEIHNFLDFWYLQLMPKKN